MARADFPLMPRWLCPAAPSFYGIAVADFNQDGIDDFATANSFVTAIGNDDISIVFGKRSGAIRPVHHVTLPLGVNATALAVGDFDGNGRADLAVGDSSGHIAVLLGNRPRGAGRRVDDV
jgi:hypothetical protein